MHIAVIGAGVAGLCAAQQVKQLAVGGTHYDVTVYEQTGNIGGQWFYTDRIGKDEYGLDIHSSMFKGLITNGPKQVTCYPDFLMTEPENCYLTSQDVLKYIEKYADHFDLKKLIKFKHHVVKVRPIENQRWEVTVKDLPNDCEEVKIFDAIMVCNGHYAVPRFPDYPGQDVFSGIQMHSHDYRTPDMFRDKNVLLVGIGPSGMDIGLAVARVARQFTLSCGPTFESIVKKLYGNDRIKPHVFQLTKTGAEFVDGDHREFDIVIYCTGYHYTFPFLTPDCGIYIDDNYVQPLYKQCINISNPTMFLIGLPGMDVPFITAYVQVRFGLCVLTGRTKLPSKEEMLEITKAEMQKCWDKGYLKRNAHKVYEFREEYYNELATLSESNLKPVLLKIFEAAMNSAFRDYTTFRQEEFRIIDDDTFESSFPTKS